MGGVMPRNLTSRQKKLIAAIAAGKTQTAAYKEAGYAANGKPRTTVRSARRLAQHAEVRAAIEEMQVQLLPDPGDVREIRAHAMGVIVRLSLEAEEEKVRLAAAQWLHEETGKQIAERERLKAEPPREESAEEVIVQLRKLYATVLGEQVPLVEAVSDGTVAEEATGLLGGGEPSGESSNEEASWTSPSAKGEEGSGGTTAPASSTFTMQRITPPGYFPAKFKRVPAR